MRDPAQFSPGAGTSAGVGVGVGVGVRAHTGDRGIALPANGTDARLDAGCGGPRAVTVAAAASAKRKHAAFGH